MRGGHTVTLSLHDFGDLLGMVDCVTQGCCQPRACLSRSPGFHMAHDTSKPLLGRLAADPDAIGRISRAGSTAEANQGAKRIRYWVVRSSITLDDRCQMANILPLLLAKPHSAQNRYYDPIKATFSSPFEAIPSCQILFAARFTAPTQGTL